MAEPSPIKPNTENRGDSPAAALAAITGKKAVPTAAPADLIASRRDAASCTGCCHEYFKKHSYREIQI
jgi:hypothetical protein